MTIDFEPFRQYLGTMAIDGGFRRVLYTSVPAGTDFETDRINIIHQSQRNNGLDGVTGVLWSAPDLYLQLLEGPPEAVRDTFQRIRADHRHHNVTILTDKVEAMRVFGAWSMANIWGKPLPATLKKLRELVEESAHPTAPEITARLS